MRDAFDEKWGQRDLEKLYAQPRLEAKACGPASRPVLSAAIAILMVLRAHRAVFRIFLKKVSA